MRPATFVVLQTLAVSGAVWMYTPTEALPIQKSGYLSEVGNAGQHHEVISQSLSPTFLSTAVSSELSAKQKVGLSSEDGKLICAISSEGRACRNRQLDTKDGYISGASCPKGLCCSKTMCGIGGCGEYCSSNWVFCSTNLIYYSDKSYGGDCNCEKQKHQCHEDAECVENLQAGGGVRCKCKEGFIGDGKTCTPDPCLRRGNEKCGSSGKCIVVDANTYTCECADGEVLETLPEGGYGCTRTGCRAYSKNCLPGKCIDDDSRPKRYSCECPQETWRSNERSVELCYPTCQEMDGNKNCGPGSCKATGVDSYTCDCPEGYHRSVTSQSTETCVKGTKDTSLADRCEKELGISLASCNKECDCSKCGASAAHQPLRGEEEPGSGGSATHPQTGSTHHDEKLEIVFKCPSGYQAKYDSRTVSCEEVKE